jgi:hypothetical protein
MMIFFKLCFCFLIFSNKVFAKFFNDQIEIISPCDGAIKFDFFKHNHYFPFTANNALQLQQYYLKINKITVTIDCNPDYPAMFNLRANINDKLIVSDNKWICNNHKSKVYVSKEGYFTPDYTFQNFDMLMSFWIGFDNLSKITCTLIPDDYVDSVIDTIPSQTESSTSAPTKTPSTVSSMLTKNPTYQITKSPTLYKPSSALETFSPTTQITDNPTNEFTWAPSPAPTSLMIPSPAPTSLMIPSPAPTSLMIPSPAPTTTIPTAVDTQTARTMSPTSIIDIYDGFPFEISVNIVSNDKILTINSNLLIGELETYTNNSFIDFNLQSTNRLNLRLGLGNERWKDCQLHSTFSLNTDKIPSINNLKQCFESKEFQDDMGWIICEIRSIDILYRENCKALNEACNQDFDCCNEATCKDKTCSLENEGIEKLICNSNIANFESEWFGYIVTEDCEKGLLIEAEGKDIYVYDKPDRLLRMDDDSLYITLEPLQIYYVKIITRDFTCKKPVSTTCF